MAFAFNARLILLALLAAKTRNPSGLVPLCSFGLFSRWPEYRRFHVVRFHVQDLAVGVSAIRRVSMSLAVEGCD